jgi:hypothetical protein
MALDLRDPNEPRGIGGWLGLLAFGILTNPARLGSNLENARRAYANAEIHALIDWGSRFYDRNWANLYFFDVQVAPILIAGAVLLIPLFFMKHRWFPKAFAAFTAVVTIVRLLTLFFVMNANSTSPRFRWMVLIEASVGTAVMLAWTIYLFKSRRARNTFVR